MSAEAYQHRLGRGAFHGMIDRTPLPLLNTSLIPLFFPFSSFLICFHVDGWRRLRRSRAVSHCTKQRPSRLEKSFPFDSKPRHLEESRRNCDALSHSENLRTWAFGGRAGLEAGNWVLHFWRVRSCGACCSRRRRLTDAGLRGDVVPRARRGPSV